ncbi:GPP34 family phosphoprotein [Lentzea sp. BCCO 10_0856]|uniref:GPP34 family phosphoprotein n=1 Tax=Lentzea miocenica TaxID=3095431 RepID=A0ABU4T2E9_9PSEU|nr:GPP34 family phosphoprotein [Lentzea sp. BCCO 10_0856]MDX8032327.1 GPP34 family phosphoprotein [Lentzea sp. BCCO 10_0856]
MLPEDLMLLFLDEVAGGVRMDSTSVQNSLAGAVLLELVNSGRVAFEADGKRLAAVDAAPLTNAFLQESLSRITKPMKPQRAVEKLRNHVKDNVMAQLDARGVLKVEKTKILGIFPSKTYTLNDPGVVSELRRQVGEVAQGYRAPDERSGALISLLYAVKGVHKVFQGDKREMNARAKEISAGNWAGVAVKKAIEAVHAATTAAVVASTAAFSGGGSN